jgi:hypothetical protein
MNVYSVGKIENFEYESECKNGGDCAANGYEETEREIVGEKWSVQVKSFKLKYILCNLPFSRPPELH